ncbi:hypothetical protein AL053_00755 [Pseudomonas savastanoi pv. fraxini]|uniref:hypothetical protein n=1 Tax=Pseudomonas savastanoi TaxID=29438 RepID=UPI00073A0F95|nr:hypothetical protein [Pseudomonas savastanoi]KUG40599.1 hypothetical protein ALP79_200198 [Pseudomonas savastanoi pv. fraxini]KWS64606.1 hypothetical protein AL053_00755 [Pseudomonas savastanoi pv. fraxini]
MSKRRAFGEVVQVQDENGQPPYLVKLIQTADGAEPDDCMYECGDPDCREWRIAEVLDDQALPAGQRIYHVTECNMSDPTG